MQETYRARSMLGGRDILKYRIFHLCKNLFNGRQTTFIYNLLVHPGIYRTPYSYNTSCSVGCDCSPNHYVRGMFHSGKNAPVTISFPLSASHVQSSIWSNQVEFGFIGKYHSSSIVKSPVFVFLAPFNTFFPHILR